MLCCLRCACYPKCAVCRKTSVVEQAHGAATLTAPSTMFLGIMKPRWCVPIIPKFRTTAMKIASSRTVFFREVLSMMSPASGAARRKPSERARKIHAALPALAPGVAL
jgi:hypothetical protein